MQLPGGSPCACRTKPIFSPMRARTSTFLMAALLLSGLGLAIPQPGGTFPSLDAEDLTGRPVNTEEWLRSPSLIVVTTEREGSEQTRAWFDTAKAKSPPDLQMRSILSLHLPFFVSEGKARAEARKEVPQEDWDDTILDVRGQSAKTLGLSASEEPYVFLVDAHGRVLASAHSPADAPQSRAVWEALEREQESPAGSER